MCLVYELVRETKSGIAITAKCTGWLWDRKYNEQNSFKEDNGAGESPRLVCVTGRQALALYTELQCMKLLYVVYCVYHKPLQRGR